MSFQFFNYYVARPSVAPTIDNTGGTYYVATRRVSFDGRHSGISPVNDQLDFPVTVTPQTYSDSYSHQYDEILISTDGVSWQVASQSSPGPVTLNAYDNSWPSTSINDNQDLELTSLNFGEFGPTNEPEQTFYILNRGSNIRTLAFNFTDTTTNNIAIDLSGKIRVDLLGILTAAGNNLSTTYAANLIWEDPTRNLNTFNLVAGQYNVLKFRLTLTGFTTGGLQQVASTLNVQVTANPKLYPLSYPEKWLDGTFLYDPDRGYEIDLISGPSSNVVEAKPFIYNYKGMLVSNPVIRTINISTQTVGTSYYLIYGTNGSFKVEETTYVLAEGETIVAQFTKQTSTIDSISYPWAIRTNDFGFYSPNGTVDLGRFVTYDGTGLSHTTSLGSVIGISMDGLGHFAKSGQCRIQLGESVASGDRLGPGTNGKAFIDNDGPLLALEGGSTDDLIVAEILTMSAGVSGGGTDENIKISANDTTSDYLINKLVAGSGITLSEDNDGGNETITIESSSSGSLVEVYAVANTSQSIPNGANTLVSYDTVDFDSESGFNTTTNEFTAAANCTCNVNFSVEFLNFDDDVRCIIVLEKNNGGGWVDLVRAETAATPSVRPIVFAATVVRLLTGDRLRVQAFQNSGSSMTISNNPGRTTFSIFGQRT